MKFYIQNRDNNYKAHKHRRRQLPEAHKPNTLHFNLEILVSKIQDKNKPELMKVFKEDPDHFRSDNIRLGAGLQSLFKNNILFLCDYYGIGVKELFRFTSQMGIKGTYQAFLGGNGKRYCSILYLAMFSRIFGIEAGVLVGVDLRILFDNSR
jgi:hypothetical protein